jgi:hypothetical protein
MDSDLDTFWIEEFEKVESDYKSFYTEKINNVKLNYIYISKDNEIEKIGKDVVFLSQENHISREEMIKILKQNMIHNNKKYSVLSILKYNIDIDPQDVSFYLKNEHDKNAFLHVVKHIDDIILNDTINMFQDLNNIIIIFNERTESLNKTKKVIVNTKRFHKGTRR